MNNKENWPLPTDLEKLLQTIKRIIKNKVALCKVLEVVFPKQFKMLEKILLLLDIEDTQEKLSKLITLIESNEDAMKSLERIFSLFNKDRAVLDEFAKVITKSPPADILIWLLQKSTRYNPFVDIQHPLFHQTWFASRSEKTKAEKTTEPTNGN